MKIVIVSTFMNHYHIQLSDELYRLTDGCFYFVETKGLPVEFKKGGFSDYDRPYIIHAWESKESEKKAIRLAVAADVMIVGGGKFVVKYEKERLKYNKLTFESAERILKRGLVNMISPTNILTQLYYHLSFFRKPLYKLCISGYAATDMYFQRAYINKCYKFAYFPSIPDLNPEEMFEKQKMACPHIKIIWCARFIKWKHPELAVLLAERLRDKGYDFEINMIGGGPLYDNIKELIDAKGLADFVHLLGNHPNKEVLEMMARHHIFLFTSDKNEGWGVVLNEAMGRVCCPVASHLIGAVPFLLEHKSNGLVFESGNLDSLTENIEFLINHPDEMKRMSLKAYFTMKDTWNPCEVAKRLIRFFEEFLLGNVSFSYKDGPLSVATPISESFNLQ